MTRFARFIAALCLVVPIATAAFAGEMLAPPGAARERGTPAVPAHQVERAAAPLLYALPTLGTGADQVLEIRVLQGKYWLVRETVALPDAIPADASIDVLYTHPAELTRLRGIEKETPGSLRFIARVGERVITDQPFAAIDAGSAKVSRASMIGRIGVIEGRTGPRLRMGAESKDPACTEHCDVSLASCLEWCDPRGDDCNMCYVWFQPCWDQCGDIPDPCMEPKSTSTYTTSTPVSSYFAGPSVCSSPYHPTTLGQYYDRYNVNYRIDHYTRTTHCDDSYTDTFTGSTYASAFCWVHTNFLCTSTTPYAPYPQCP